MVCCCDLGGHVLPTFLKLAFVPMQNRFKLFGIPSGNHSLRADFGSTGEERKKETTRKLQTTVSFFLSSPVDPKSARRLGNQFYLMSISLFQGWRCPLIHATKGLIGIILIASKSQMLVILNLWPREITSKHCVCGLLFEILSINCAIDEISGFGGTILILPELSAY